MLDLPELVCYTYRDTYFQQKPHILRYNEMIYEVDILRRRRKSTGSAALKKLMIFLIFAFIFSCFAVYYAQGRLKPLLKSYSVAKTTSLSTLAVNEAVNERLNSTAINYEDIVSINRDEKGKITSIETDISAFNRLKAEITGDIVAKMDKITESEIAIPVGNLIGGEILYGRGPSVHIKIIPVGSAKTDIVNQFTEAGINQTRHQILLHVSTEVYTVLPSETVESTVESDFILAETIIVGEIPDFYVQ